jgi:hypothetical protein
MRRAAGAGGAAGPPPFRAYDVEVVADDFGKRVTALCPHGAGLIAGLEDGSLLFFEAPAPADGGGGNASSGSGSGGAAAAAGGGGGAAPWQVARVEKAFCKRAVLQLAVVLDGPADVAAGRGPALLVLTGE